MKKILITGSTGFLASRFINKFNKKYNIIPITRNDLDINNENAVITLLTNHNADYVIHTAAIADTGICENDPDLSFQVNVKASLNIAKGCKISNSKLIYLSSEQLYNGNIECGPYSETCIPVPNTVYGKHKLEAEKEIQNILNDVVILRLTWLFGLPERNRKVNSNILWNVVKAALKNDPLKLPIHEFRGMTYVYDILDAFPQILDLPSGIYNTGSENNLSTYDAACLILKKMGLEHKIPELLIKDTEKYKDDPRDLRISNNKLKNNNIIINDTSEGIKKCIKDFSLNL